MTGSEFEVAFTHFTTTTEFVLLFFGGLVALILFRLALAKYKINFLPESALIILFGIAIGLILHLTKTSKHDLIHFNYDIFFLILIPPIILEAGYFLHKDFFFTNLRLIMLYAVIGTLLNSFLVGISLFLFRSQYAIKGSFAEYLTFGALISAVDPVAVLAIFEQAHVNETLQILVSGESILNDSVAIVLYQLFVNLTKVSHITNSLPFLAIVRFFLVSFGGVAFGVFMGLLSSWLTKFTKVLQLFEPILLLSLGFLSYQIAEAMSLSGIVSILFCGIIFSRYSDMNLTHRSSLTFKRDLKSFASMNEAIIFLYLGFETTFQFSAKDSNKDYTHDLDAVFTILTLVFILLYRFILVVILTYFANRSRMHKVKLKDQLILSYSGLRGAIAFALAFSLPDSIKSKNSFISTTLIVVLFTVFIQGGTIKPIMKRLHLKFLQKENEKKCARRMLSLAFSHIQNASFLIIGGNGGTYSWSHKFHDLDLFLKKIIVRGLHPEEKQFIELLEQLKEAEVKEELNEREKQRLLVNQTKFETISKNPNVSLERILHEKRVHPSTTFQNLVKKKIFQMGLEKREKEKEKEKEKETDQDSEISKFSNMSGSDSTSSSLTHEDEPNIGLITTKIKKGKMKRMQLSTNTDPECVKNEKLERTLTNVFMQFNLRSKPNTQELFSRTKEPNDSFDKNIKILPGIVGRGNHLKNISMKNIIQNLQSQKHDFKERNIQRSIRDTNILSSVVSRHLLPQIRLKTMMTLNKKNNKIQIKKSSSSHSSSSSLEPNSSSELEKKNKIVLEEFNTKKSDDEKKEN
ncbi:sodium/hydrogen exchanger [Anaeramoeba flamelloides]|uniref:Sodium/hydrogen exchanger n=1 Tax=Anaeramoeba flamelloides TaxID=1746091 RepID=A0ABQ8Y958_9EUKA|nr:sodium/hydrogen exchanger [Anaeramoeba flamelloides]